MQRSGIELGEDANFGKAGVEAIAYWDVDKPVFSCEWDGRFAARFCQRIQPISAPATHYYAMNITSHLGSMMVRVKKMSISNLDGKRDFAFAGAVAGQFQLFFASKEIIFCTGSIFLKNFLAFFKLRCPNLKWIW
jgi:hypothetical protein